MDEELIEELNKITSKNQGEDLYPEHELIASCLSIGLSLQDLKDLTYIDVLKILLSYLRGSKKEYQKEDIRQATQKDWDMLAGG